MKFYISDGVLRREPDPRAKNTSLLNVRDGVRRLTIPEGVRSIEPYAFYGKGTLRFAALPRSLMHIGQNAFAACPALGGFLLSEDHPHLRFENDLLFTRSGELLISLFSGKELTVGEGITSIAASAFEGCPNLERVTLPDSLRVIGTAAFCGCSRLRSISLPDGLRAIGASAFYGCLSLRELHIPQQVGCIEESAFSGCDALEIISLAPHHLRAFKPQISWDSCRALCCPAPLRQFPAYLRGRACAGFARQEERFSPELHAEYAAYISKNAASLVKTAFDQPMLLDLMLREGLIDAQSLPSYLDESSRCGGVERTALLLEYGRRFSRSDAADDLSLDGDAP